ncbi:MAG: hypothetical protein FJ358_00870 [Thaumarchaeota archaeon]|nr:hypothetical protein [Nitrososphaerota archaeon]
MAKDTQKFSLILRAQVLIAGAAVMVLELLSSRLLAPYYGSTLFVWGSLIGVVLLGLASGYYYGGRKADVNPNYSQFSALIFFTGVYTMLITYTASTLFQFVLALRLGERYGPLVAALLILALPSFMLGGVSPYAIKLSTRSLDRVGRTAGDLYSLSTIGSIAGTFLTTFILIPELGVNTILYILSSILIIASIFGLASRLKVLAVLLIALSMGFAVAPQIPSGGVIFSKDTLYHKLVVQDDIITGIRTLILDNNFHSAIDLRDRDRVVYPYTGFFHIGMAYNPSIENVLFIGGGGLSAPKRFLNDYPNVRADVVEIDGDVVKAAEQYFFVEENPRLRIFIEDGRTYLANTDKKYDLVVLDAYAKTYIPFHMMTKEYFELISSRLSDDGIVVSNVIASLEGSSSAIFHSMLKTMQSVFPSADVYPVSGEIPLIQNIIVVATKSPQEFSMDALQQNAAIIKLPRINDYLANRLAKSPSTNDAPLFTDNYAPAENLLNPLTGKTYIKEIEFANKTLVSVPQTINPPRESLSFDSSTTIITAIVATTGFIVLAVKSQQSKKQINRY